MIRNVVNPWHPNEVRTGDLLAVVRHPYYLVHDYKPRGADRMTRTIVGYRDRHTAETDMRRLRRAIPGSVAVGRPSRLL